LFSRASDPARHAPRGRLVRVFAAPDLEDLAAETVIAEAIGVLQSAARPAPDLEDRHITQIVLAGLVPAIHVGPRDKPGDDEFRKWSI